MTGSTEVRTRLRRSAIVAGALLVVAGALLAARAQGEDQQPHRATAAAPAVAAHSATATESKSICTSLTPATLPHGVKARDRTLVPFSSTILGVDATWADDRAARSIEVLDGGYVDDITEPYDNLRPVAGTTVGGTAVTVLTTVFLRRPVYLGYWRQPGVARPCDVHAVVTIGLPRAAAYAVFASLR